MTAVTDGDENLPELHEEYRPLFHFTPPMHWMNDPNGLVYFEGEYHLFYQHYPNGNTWGPMNWGHAVSEDLVTWDHLPIALSPNHHGHIFSGSAVVDWEDTSGFFDGKPGLVAIFTHADEYPDSGRPRQRQSLAYSQDKGRTWTMYEGNPVLCREEFTDFRDPKVFWHSPSNRWVMTLAVGDRVHFYTSADLKTWSFASEFGAHEGSHEGVWECPDLIELPMEGQAGGHVDGRVGAPAGGPVDGQVGGHAGARADRTKWVLIVSIGDHPSFPEGSRTQYFVGHFDGITFVNDAASETVLWLDHGRDNYAGVTWSNLQTGVQIGMGEKLFIGWMSNWRYANVTPTERWRGAMTLARALSLKVGSSGVHLVQRPVTETQKLRRKSKVWQDVTVQQGYNLLAEEQGVTYEMECEIELGDATEVGFKLRKSAAATDGGMTHGTTPEMTPKTTRELTPEMTVVGYDCAMQTLFVDRRQSGDVGFHESFPCRHDVSLEAQDGRIRLHLFVDRSSIEVFANDGEIVVTDLIFPHRLSSGMEMYVLGGEAKVVSLKLHHLEVAST